MRGTDFANLRAFMTIVETGNFARAATALQIAPSTLSYTIQTLEQRLGITLLHRTTRKVLPTEAGAGLARRLAPMLSDFDTLLEDFVEKAAKPTGVLKLCIPRIPMALYMEPLLSGFEAAYPEVTIDLTIGDFVTDITASGFDAGVVPNRDLGDDVVAISLGKPLKRIVYASPAYLARFGTPRHPEDLKRHNCINYRGSLTGQIYDWEFQNDGNRFTMAVSGSRIVSDTTFALSAALKGQGIGYGIEQLSQPFIEAGSLVSILDEWIAPHPGFVLAYAKVRHATAAMKALASYVRNERRR
ncbi:LysR family transcriptional regulator [Aureimonas sp. ME7]|uniref:LysR family transcriptional regulator n=1 Tax=Aureimonas sp. ME7 TaxID=2744252 RepID=UPI0015F47511|nr:LysR family transcriptional regulator [Aureimonas sp. ME7]